MADDEMKRRDFVKGTLLGAGAIALGPGAGQVLAAGAEPGIPLVTFGRTGAKIPRLVVGTAHPISLPYIKRAYDLGAWAFDLADCYNGGNSERQMGKFLEKTGLRDRLFLTTKTCAHDLAAAEGVLNQSLERMKVDSVDMFFLHNLKDPDLLNLDLMRRVERWKKQGKIKYFGFSTHAPRLVDVMNRAGEVGWIDGILFKYNFRDYGNAPLNRAIDACARANVGLIAMKTQGSHFSFIESVKPFEAKGYSKYQAVLQAVWADDRIHAAVSAMKGFDQLEHNVAAARDKTQLGAADLDVLRGYAKATDHLYCRGCEQVCAPHLDKPVAVADTLRMLMYHDEYGEQSKARRLWSEIPAELRRIREVDFAPASRACPYGLDVGALMNRAADVLVV